jgi:hypothetical protein
MELYRLREDDLFLPRVVQRFVIRNSQLDRVIGSMNQVLFRTKISFSRLNGRVAEKQLDLLKLTAAGAA